MDMDIIHGYNGGMKTISAGNFKQTCLSVLDEVERTHEHVLITKRGRPVATLVPCRAASADWGAALRGSVKVVGDILAPAISVDEWEGSAG